MQEVKEAKERHAAEVAERKRIRAEAAEERKAEREAEKTAKKAKGRPLLATLVIDALPAGEADAPGPSPLPMIPTDLLP